MDVFLEPHPPGGAARALFEQLRDGIASGRLAGGDRLPPTRELAAQLGLSRSTITTAYGRLAAEGFIEGRAGGGSSVVASDQAPARGRRSTMLEARAELRSPAVVVRADPPLAPGAVDLRPGTPDLELFPRQVWRRYLSAAYAAPPGYGDPAGLPALRRAIARWVGRSRSVEAEAGQVIVTAGAQQAVDLVLRMLVRPRERVALEEPGYAPVRGLCAASGAVPVPVPVDHEGIVVDAIPSGVRVVYTTPSHQFPNGATMSLRRRRALLEFAERHQIAVIEDDYDSEYRHVDRPLEPLHLLDRCGRVIYVGTFSKTLAPSLRLGFVVLPESLVAPAIHLRTLMDWQPPALLQEALLGFMADGHLDRHLRRTRKVYRERHALVTGFVEAQIRAGRLSAVAGSHAGLHVAAHLTNGRHEQDVTAATTERAVALGDYGGCWATDDHPEGIMIGFGVASVAELRLALPIVAEALAEALG